MVYNLLRIYAKIRIKANSLPAKQQVFVLIIKAKPRYIYKIVDGARYIKKAKKASKSLLFLLRAKHNQTERPKRLSAR